jgi:hypothetical protein
MYQFQTRMTDVLNYPLPDRIRQMVILIETAPIKDLEAFFTTLVHSIFGSGFGQVSAMEFLILRNVSISLLFA